MKLISIVGKIIGGIISIYWKYMTDSAVKSFAEFGANSHIARPFTAHGTNSKTPGVKYIHIGNNVNIGPNSTIFATRAHLYIGDHSFSGPNLTVMTGDHPYDIKGAYMADNSKSDLLNDGVDITRYDKDIIIEEDVWLGCNVTILKGVRIERGSIVAAGSVVTHSLPAYSICGGVPARVLGFRWSVDEILEHEKIVYEEGNRLSGSVLMRERNSK